MQSALHVHVSAPLLAYLLHTIATLQRPKNKAQPDWLTHSERFIVSLIQNRRSHSRLQ